MARTNLPSHIVLGLFFALRGIGGGHRHHGPCDMDASCISMSTLHCRSQHAVTYIRCRQSKGKLFRLLLYDTSFTSSACVQLAVSQCQLPKGPIVATYSVPSSQELLKLDSARSCQQASRAMHTFKVIALHRIKSIILPTKSCLHTFHSK